MTKEFEKKILTHGTVDTAKYRYHVFEYADRSVIRRIDLKLLDTTEALNRDNWQEVKTIR